MPAPQLSVTVSGGGPKIARLKDLEDGVNAGFKALFSQALELASAGNAFGSVDSGFEATPDGGVFSVPSESEDGLFDFYKVEDGVAELFGTSADLSKLVASVGEAEGWAEASKTESGLSQVAREGAEVALSASETALSDVLAAKDVTVSASRFDDIVEDATERDALSVLSGVRVYMRSDKHIYAYDGAVWVDKGLDPTAGKAEKSEVMQEEYRASGEEQQLLLLVSQLRQSLINHGGDVTFDMPSGFVEPIYGSQGQLAAFEYASVGRFILDGAIVGTEAALLASTGLTSVGGALATATPWVASERFAGISNQLFDADVSDWDTAATDAVISWSADNGGQLVFEAGGTSLENAKQKVMPDDGTYAGLCLAISGTAMRGTTVNSITFSGTTYATHFSGNNVNSTSIASTDATVPADPAYLSTASGNQAYVGVKNTSASGSGTLLVPEFDVREVRPFEAFPSGQWDAYFEFTLPETATEDVVIFDGFASPTAKQHSRLTILWRIADEHLVVQLRVNNTAATALDLGEVALGGSHQLALRMKDQDYGASLDGAAAVFSTGLKAVGISSFETSATLTRLALFESMGDNNWLATVT
ncbi:MAG: hypothetical protein ACSHX3_15720, partial [Litorimonas sp.]